MSSDVRRLFHSFEQYFGEESQQYQDSVFLENYYEDLEGQMEEAQEEAERAARAEEEGEEEEEEEEEEGEMGVADEVQMSGMEGEEDGMGRQVGSGDAMEDLDSEGEMSARKGLRKRSSSSHELMDDEWIPGSGSGRKVKRRRAANDEAD